MRDTAYILCANANSNANYTSWLSQLSMRVEIEGELSVDWPIPPDAAILITHIQYRHHEVSVLRRAMEQNIPVLILADGILEYRNTWENPKLPTGAIFNPIVGHKLACIGASQKRWIESWGGRGQCEIVGLPRLDALLPAPKPQGISPQLSSVSQDDTTTEEVAPSDAAKKPFRILVATARQPGFNGQQRNQTKAALTDLKHWAETSEFATNHDVQIHWRVTDNLATEVGLVNDDESLNEKPLTEVLTQFDALMTTPSTTMLEGMLHDIPTAVLDYYQVPLYVPAAWQITHAAAIEPVIEKMLNLAPPMMEFQRSILHDSLCCDSPAAPRLIQLIERMVAFGQECHNANQKLEFPADLLLLEEAEVPESRTESANVESPEVADATDLPVPESVYSIELEHARRRIRSDEEQIGQLSTTVRQESQRANRLDGQMRTTTKRLKEQEKSVKKLTRREHRLVSNLKQKATRIGKLQVQARKLARASQHRKQLDAKRLQTRKKLLRQQESLRNRLQSVSKHRGSLLSRLKQNQRRERRLSQQLQHRENELESIKSNWLVGPVVRLMQRVGKKPDQPTTIENTNSNADSVDDSRQQNSDSNKKKPDSAASVVSATGNTSSNSENHSKT